MIPSPLADRIRPQTIHEVVGQKHLLGEGAPLRSFFESGEFPSIILWGPPGVGKTTIALLIAREVNYSFIRLSAIEAGVKDVREVIASAKNLLNMGQRTLLFIDEIHRFNKNQQDALLHAVETGVITLIGATTENPSFEVNSALLSRCQIYRLKALTDEEIGELLKHALQTDEVLKEKNIEIEDWEFLLKISAGDARTALNALDLALKTFKKDEEKIVITRNVLEKALQQKTAHYDKKGESHYDTISAFIKSMRGSDPDAALFWLAKMLDAGEQPEFIARRMVIFASEDIGNADVFALQMAVTVFQAVAMIGMPEARIILSQGVTYLAACPKSNASYLAIGEALEEIKKGADATVPMHLRNAPTRYMKQEGYGKDYQYPHNFKNHFVRENYFPVGYSARAFYKPGNFGKEKSFQEWLKALWPERYDR
jgi:putative ATPase